MPRSANKMREDRAKGSRGAADLRSPDVISRPARLVVAGLAAVLVLAAAPAAAARRSEPRVRHLTLVLNDRSRPTEDPNGVRSGRSRILVTELYLPRTRRPAPMVVFAHGNAGHPLKLSQLLTAWARAGYVVAAPAFPLTNDRSGQPSILVDYVNQPGDVSFVIDEVLRRSQRPESRLYRRIDTHHIGLAGHSLGGATALGATFNSCCRDRRIDALVVMDGRLAPFADGRDVFRPMPLLLIHLRSDPVVQFRYAEEIFAAAKPPKYLMALREGVHFEPFEDVPNPHDRAVVAATTAFWDAYLRGERDARREVVRAGTEPGESTVTARLR
jgi:dienelactone hydrolase